MLESIFGGILAMLVALGGYLYKHQNKRLDEIEISVIRQKLAMERKLEAARVKELIDYKLAPLHVMFKEIQDDIREIKEELKRKH